ncbi:hypothetical protein HYX13_05725 [Candidatus Woesearchaeota archaeon]|nr:hypothetical protein [Candidatus Woesearchaeota archaeon]
MTPATFRNPIEPMGPYYSEADLNDEPVSRESTAALEKLIQEAEGSLACELKEDGFRCQAHVDGKEVKLFTRGSGEFELRCFPEITEALQKLRLKKTIFDAELRGAASKYGGFKAMQARARYKGRISEKALKEYLQTKPTAFPLQLVVFDVLMNKSIPLIGEANSCRRTVLEELISNNNTNDSNHTNGINEVIIPASRILAYTPQEISHFYNQKVREEHYEGVVLKSPVLEYLPGDKTHWVKLKKFETLDLVVLGLSGGKGAGVPFGQALVGTYHPKKKVYQTLGFVNLLRENPVTGKLFAEEIYTLAGKTRTFHPKNVEVGSKKPEVYLTPHLVVEVRAMNIDQGNYFACSEEGKNFYSLRIAHIKCIREDKLPMQATTTEFVAKYYTMQR